MLPLKILWIPLDFSDFFKHKAARLLCCSQFDAFLSVCPEEATAALTASEAKSGATIADLTAQVTRLTTDLDDHKRQVSSLTVQLQSAQSESERWGFIVLCQLL